MYKQNCNQKNDGDVDVTLRFIFCLGCSWGGLYVVCFCYLYSNAQELVLRRFSHSFPFGIAKYGGDCAGEASDVYIPFNPKACNSNSLM